MQFNSLEYGLFFPAVVALYFLVRPAWRTLVLLVVSYAFYASWNVAFLPLIAAMTFLNYVVGLVAGARTGRSRRLWTILGVATNLAVLALYKYAAFLLFNLETGLRWVGLGVNLTSPIVTLPLAISFFTFEFVHYVVDVGRGHPPERSLLKFAVFAAFFPTQIAGPIKRYQSFIPQLAVVASFDWTRTGEGTALIVRGMFKKTVIADRLAPIVERGFAYAASGSGHLTTLDAWLTVLAFAIQVYLDFSGYTDIGRGSALVLGFSVPENFRRPYLATNITEFWNRWHISLSTWLRDYVFVPLGGLRKHPHPQLVVTMGLCGLWHGASWHFVLWGLFQGLLMSARWAFGSVTRGKRPPFRASVPGAEVVRWAATFGLVCIGYALFRAPTVSAAVEVVASMVGAHTTGTPVLLPPERALAAGIVAGWLLMERVGEARERGLRVARRRRWIALGVAGLHRLRPAAYALLLAVVIVASYDARVPFIYFRF